MMAVDTAMVTVLMVEDSPADAEFFNEAVLRANLPMRTIVVPDGLAAMKFLRRQNGYDQAPRPDLVVLDLNLPVMNGQDVLAAIMADTDLRDIPLVVLTTSKSERHIIEPYADRRWLRFHAKTADFRALVGIVRQLFELADSARRER